MQYLPLSRFFAGVFPEPACLINDLSSPGDHHVHISQSIHACHG
jgi:hypothetical protein